MAVATFFVLAIVGTLCGAAPWACGLRALAGAAAMYLLTRVATRVIISILVESVVKGTNRPMGDDHESTR